MQIMDTTFFFFYNNSALLKLIPQLDLPLLLFTLPSRQYFSSTEDLNTWLSGSTQGEHFGLSADTHMNTLVLPTYFVSGNQFLF